MVTVKLYVEGAASKNDRMRTRCREAFSAFFQTAGITSRPRTVPCGGREDAYNAFVTAVRTAKPGDLPLLLVDSEDPVTAGHSNWQHLKRRDNWDRHGGVKDDQVFLMVQVMESWFLADLDALRRYFGPAFSDTPFRAWPALEAVPKLTVYDVLETATADCKQPYKKGDVSFEILGRLDATKVEAACPHAKELLNRLRSL
jgi:hypothetical protein